MTVIKTNRFVLRPFNKTDSVSLAKNINNKKIYDVTLNIPYPYSSKDADEWINKNIKVAKKEEATMVNFAIDIDDEVCGGVGLRDIKEGQAELGYWLAEKHWGKGIMTRAIKEVTKVGFETLGLNRIYSDVMPTNIASARVLEKNGFRKKELLKRHAKKNGKWIDHYRFEMVV